MLLNQVAIESRSKELEDFLSKKENKKLAEAVGILNSVDMGDLLVNQKETQNIEITSKNTIIYYNHALIKDIANSYSDLIDAIKIVHDSEIKKILSDELSINGIGLEVIKLDDGTSSVFKKSELSKMESFPESVFNKSNMAFNTKKAYYDYGKTFRLREDNTINALLADYKIIPNKAKFIKLDDERFIINGAISYGQMQGVTLNFIMAQVESSFGLDYADMILAPSGTDIDNMLRLTKSTEMLTYGEIKQTEEFTPSKKHRYIYTNSNFTQVGYDNYHIAKEHHAKIMSILQKSLDTSIDVNSVIERLSDLKENFFDFEIIFIDTLKQKQEELEIDSIEKIAEFLNVSYESYFRKAQEYANDLIDKREEPPLPKDFESIIGYFKNLRLREDSYEIFLKMTNAIEEINNKINIEEGDDTSVIKKLTKRTRATIKDIKVDSLVINIRDGEVELNPKAQELYKKNSSFKNIVDSFSKNKYHDFIEIDAGVAKSKHINFAYLENFSERILDIDIPVYQKTALKFRLLGNYKANGIYMAGANIIALDFMKSSAYIHELVHSIDISAHLNKHGRDSLYRKLYGHFDKNIDKKNNLKVYFLKDVELIARAGEIGYILKLVDFESLNKDFVAKKINEEQLIESIKERFLSNPHNFYVKDYDYYNSAQEYLHIDDLIKSGNIRFLLEIENYFKPFFTEKISDIDLIPTVKGGWENREVEGISPKAFVARKIYEPTVKLQSSLFEPIHIIKGNNGDMVVENTIGLDILKDIRQCTRENYESIQNVLEYAPLELIKKNPLGYLINHNKIQLIEDEVLIRESKEILPDAFGFAKKINEAIEQGDINKWQVIELLSSPYFAKSYDLKEKATTLMLEIKTLGISDFTPQMLSIHADKDKNRLKDFSPQIAKEASLIIIKDSTSYHSIDTFEETTNIVMSRLESKQERKEYFLEALLLHENTRARDIKDIIENNIEKKGVMFDNNYALLEKALESLKIDISKEEFILERIGGAFRYGITEDKRYEIEESFIEDNFATLVDNLIQKIAEKETVKSKYEELVVQMMAEYGLEEELAEYEKTKSIPPKAQRLAKKELEKSPIQKEKGNIRFSVQVAERNIHKLAMSVISSAKLSSGDSVARVLMQTLQELSSKHENERIKELMVQEMKDITINHLNIAKTTLNTAWLNEAIGLAKDFNCPLKTPRILEVRVKKEMPRLEFAIDKEIASIKNETYEVQDSLCQTLIIRKLMQENDSDTFVAYMTQIKEKEHLAFFQDIHKKALIEMARQEASGWYISKNIKQNLLSYENHICSSISTLGKDSKETYTRFDRREPWIQKFYDVVLNDFKTTGDNDVLEALKKKVVRDKTAYGGELEEYIGIRLGFSKEIPSSVTSNIKTPKSNAGIMTYVEQYRDYNFTKKIISNVSDFSMYARNDVFKASEIQAMEEDIKKAKEEYPLYVWHDLDNATKHLKEAKELLAQYGSLKMGDLKPIKEANIHVMSKMQHASIVLENASMCEKLNTQQKQMIDETREKLHIYANTYNNASYEERIFGSQEEFNALKKEFTEVLDKGWGIVENIQNGLKNESIFVDKGIVEYLQKDGIIKEPQKIGDEVHEKIEMAV